MLLVFLCLVSPLLQSMELYCNEVQSALSLEKGTPVFSYPNSHLYVTALLRASCCFSRTLPTATQSSPSPSVSTGTDHTSISRMHPQAPPHIAMETSPFLYSLPPLYPSSSLGSSSTPGAQPSSADDHSAPPLSAASQAGMVRSGSEAPASSDVRYLTASYSVTRQIPVVQDGRRSLRQRHTGGKHSGSHASPLTAGEGVALFRMSGSAMTSYHRIRSSPGKLSPGGSSSSWAVWNSSSFERRCASVPEDAGGGRDVSGSLQSWVWVDGAGLESESSGTAV